MCDSSRQWYTLLTRSKLLSPERHLRTKVPLDNFPATFPNCLPQSITSSNTTPSSSDDSEISTSVSPMNKDGVQKFFEIFICLVWMQIHFVLSGFILRLFFEKNWASTFVL
ncbi:hypothetical protein J6590_001017 [Homalodisca vitripennis]|nr:hypothetical protein J6590_001017 [Homalodisca vitripennis]